MTLRVSRVHMQRPSTLVEIISTQLAVLPSHSAALLRPSPALLTSASTPAPGHRFTMIRGSATTSASCQQCCCGCYRQQDICQSISKHCKYCSKNLTRERVCWRTCIATKYQSKIASLGQLCQRLSTIDKDSHGKNNLSKSDRSNLRHTFKDRSDGGTKVLNGFRKAPAGQAHTLVISHTTGKKSAIGMPRETRSCCRDSSFSRLRATATTRIPASASASQMAQPMPADAPVTRATLPRHLDKALESLATQKVSSMHSHAHAEPQWKASSLNAENYRHHLDTFAHT